MKLREVPIDFFSWHVYNAEIKPIEDKAERIKDMLIKHGYGSVESILNEWNYVKGWEEEFVYSLKMIHGLKNAAFITAVMSMAQKSSIDMLMYYDTRQSGFNGIFDFYTYEKLKGYYPMMWYSNFYKLENEVRAEQEVEQIYSLCGVGKDGKITAMLTYYTDDDYAPKKDIALDFGRNGKYEIYLLDETHDGELIEVTEQLEFTLERHSCILIKEV